MIPRVVWLTGLSGAGKTTIANLLSSYLTSKGFSVKLLDGDDIRSSIHSHLGFTAEDIIRNNHLVAEWCRKHIDKYDFIIVAMISPFIKSREEVGKIVGDGYVEVFVRASLVEVIRRDVKGLYINALSGKMQNFIGIDPAVPYEVPTNPTIVIDTEKSDAEACLKTLISRLGV